mgnify:CR=1 FL=1
MIRLQTERREFLRSGVGLASLTLPSYFALRAKAETTQIRPKAKACIVLYCWGGISHYESWDPKPNAPSALRGEFKPISTNVPDIQICEHFPRMARMMDNPMIQSLMDNPELMRGMMRANPQMRALLESNPELARALEDPNLLRQSMRAMRARQDSAENFSRLDALLFTATAWIFIPAYCFAVP